MAGTLQFDLVSPERRLASLQVTEVQIPGAEGDLTAMEGHAPAITTLRPGILRAKGGTEDVIFAVSGGFAEITATGVSVLAERAIPVDAEAVAVVDVLVAEAIAAVETAEDQAEAALLANDLQALRQALVR